MFQFQNIGQKKWVESKEHTDSESYDWYNNCQYLKIPFLRILKRRKYADLDWDYEYLECEVQPRLIQAEYRRLLDSLQIIFNECGATRKSLFEGKLCTGSIKDFPIDKVDELASEFYSILCEAAAIATVRSKLTDRTE